MNPYNLKFEGIYTYQNQHLMFWGLSSDGNYLFYNYDTTLQKMCGVPGSLTEDEVKRSLKIYSLSRVLK